MTGSPPLPTPIKLETEPSHGIHASRLQYLSQVQKLNTRPYLILARKDFGYFISCQNFNFAQVQPSLSMSTMKELRPLPRTPNTMQEPNTFMLVITLSGNVFNRMKLIFYISPQKTCLRTCSPNHSTESCWRNTV
jgi:hypothetical protein